MNAMASQITSLTIVYSAVYSGADQRKHQSSASLAFCGNSSVFPAQMAIKAENVSIWWRHHESWVHRSWGYQYQKRMRFSERYPTPRNCPTFTDNNIATIFWPRMLALWLFKAGIILGMGSAIVTSSLIGWAHSQHDPCKDPIYHKP